MSVASGHSAGTISSRDGSTRTTRPTLSPCDGVKKSSVADLTQMKLFGLAEMGPLAPKTASWMRCPGFTPRPMMTRLGALKPPITTPPVWPSTGASFPSTQTSA